MLIDETSVWRNPRTGVLERVFPSDFAPPGFRSVSPSVDELRGWLLDPVILSQLRTRGLRQLGVRARAGRS